MVLGDSVANISNNMFDALINFELRDVRKEFVVMIICVKGGDQ